MATLSQSAQSYTTSTEQNWVTRYNAFVEQAEFNRFGWAATTMMIQGCLLTPILLLTLFQFGGGDWQVLVSFLSFLLVLVPVLSALPVKYILPAFTFSALLHLTLIAMNVM
ncbi:hypothetical protein [Fibrella forsythiae]|uniref:Uncharacterized protein n=1 Tax=Fibrella forsythiae TaxID=2817061 RepID=A0ABS3JHF1_9BACT|nr:hypothetical protein [Fibrella forsythiae]MBO0949440.1 hypothetical protein [Fibrella forsythiae]